jgi:DNA-binding NtrC family response regulator
VRELKNVIERAVVLTDQRRIGKEHLPLDLAIPGDHVVPSQESFSLKAATDAYEKKIILNILERVAWNQTKAADILGIHRNTLLIKLEALGIKVKQLKQEKETALSS